MPEKNDSNNVRVTVRCRPLNSKEREQAFRQIVEVDEARNTLALHPPDGEERDSDQQERNFTFDHTFGPDSKQADVYNKVARPIVESTLEGYNGTIFAYGQTGTGKTFTMAGDRDVPELCGIIPNSFAHIFGHIAKAEGGARFLVRISYLEIYNEEVRDLLGKDQTARLEVKERVDVGVYVKDLSSFVVNNAGDMDRLMTVGNKNRVVGATNMNEHSSRSHAIFSITVECSELGVDGKQHVRTGKLHLVDLAGSERQSKTGATGIRLKEATKINLSLSTLGNVISALVDGKSTHIPYRNSKLTRLLQDSLGGNAKTAMVANVGPADYNYDETLSTLRYANRAKNIKNNARINEDPKDALLREFQKQIEDLRRQLADGGIDGEDEEYEEEYVDERTGERRTRKVRRNEKRISKAKMEEIQRRIEEDRRRLEEDKNMVEADRQKIKEDLEKKEAQMQSEKQAQQELREKLEMLERKVIVGGVNLLDKAAEQERLLEQSNAELDAHNRKAAELQSRLKEKETERLDIEERYTSLQDENEKKTAKMKRLFGMWQQTKNELQDLREEHQREKEGLLENIRQLTKELKQAVALIDGFIPSEYQELLDRSLTWNEDIGEWQLKCVAYTGNNMRKTQEEDDEPVRFDDSDLTHIYLAYSEEGARMRKMAGNPKKKKQKAAAANANAPQPTASTSDADVPTNTASAKGKARKH